MEQPSAGWYPDPSGNQNKLRYWDGMCWTDNYSDIAPLQNEVSESDKNLYLVAFIFCLLSTIGFGFFLIPLAWMIPMTVHCWRIYKGERSNNNTAFGVCTLLFLSIVGGILLLVSKKNN